jgi:hypothetical protein
MMDVVIVFNGLGNQMSQYAFYLSRNKMYRKTTCLYYDNHCHNGFELDSVFNIKLPNDNNEKGMGKIFIFLMGKNIAVRVIRKLLSFLFIVKFYFENTDDYNFDGKKKHKGYAILNFYVGGWHSYKYSENVKNDIIKIYQFCINKINIKTNNIVANIKNEESVSIHIRRGDYLNRGENKFANIATLEYYKKALEYIKYTVNNPHYYIFSDDKDWVLKNIHLDNMTIVDWNNGKESWNDMFLMSICKINVNPNSTFSWWGSYLNKNKDKIVIVPDRFISNVPNVDFYPEEWIKMQSTEKEREPLAISKKRCTNV